MSSALRLWLVLVVLLAPAPLYAMTLRYALIIGNNRGFDAETTLPPLRHAEAEASRLRERLVELSNFHPSPERTVLLKGATRSQLRRAVEALAATKERDLARLGKADTLFAVFFTGHGLRGRLLLDDGSLSGAELGELFRQMHADFTVGVFDACYSGSLDPQMLKEKGIDPTPGLNLFRELPQEILSAKGSVFFVSSGPDQPSYEDERLGGVFTHFFIEGLSSAQRDGPGITLERIWHYAREHTVEYTAARQRRQSPQQYVASLAAGGPLYFSFPLERSATLILGAAVSGTFVLSYAQGQLTEIVEKPAGAPRELAVFPGNARLLLLRDGEVAAQDELTFARGASVVVRSDLDPMPTASLGRVSEPLWEKGFGGERLQAVRVALGSSLLAGAGYTFGAFETGVVAPRHAPYLTVRLDRGAISAAVRLALAVQEERFASWGHTTMAPTAEGQLGYAFDVAALRLALRGLAAVGRAHERFDNGDARTLWFWQSGVAFGALYPAERWGVELSLRGGVLRTSGAGIEAGSSWRPWAGVDLALLWRVR